MSRKTRMLAVIREVYAGGRDLIPNWSLLRHAERAATNDRANWACSTLKAQNRKTLETFLKRHHAEGLSSRLVQVEEMFHPSTYESFKV